MAIAIVEELWTRIRAAIDDKIAAAEDAAARAEQHEAGAEAALSTKADVVHTHSIEQVNGLQTSLDGKASLVGGLIPTSQLPAVALTKPQVVPDRAGMLALTAQEGDIAVITSGTDKGTYMLGSGASTNFASWVLLAAPSDAVSSVNGQTGVVNLGTDDVGAAPSIHTHTSAQISDAVSTATASTVVKRDASARAKFADPAAAQDAATKVYVDNLVGTRIASIPTPGIVYGTDTSGNQTTYPVKGGAFEWSLAQRGANGTLKVGEPSVDTDAATKGYVDTGLSGKAAASHTHTSSQISDASSEVRANLVVKRDVYGRAQVATPNSALDAANKAYVDGLVAGVTKVQFNAANATRSSGDRIVHDTVEVLQTANNKREWNVPTGVVQIKNNSTQAVKVGTWNMVSAITPDGTKPVAVGQTVTLYIAPTGGVAGSLWIEVVGTGTGTVDIAFQPFSFF